MAETTPAGAAPELAALVVAVPRPVPQLPQKRAPLGFVAPQFGQPPRAVPQPMQKRPSDGLAVPHVWQITIPGE